MCRNKKIWFQNYDKELTEILINLINGKLEHPKLIIALPPQIFNIFSNYSKKCVDYWLRFNKTRHSIYFKKHILNKEKIYGSSYITRINEIGNKQIILEKFRKLWHNKKVVYLISNINKYKWATKLELMFNNTESIEYIEIPPQNAWQIKNDIINKVINNYDNNYMILASCGPTATALAYEFTCKNYQFIDIGHLIEILVLNHILHFKQKIQLTENQQANKTQLEKETTSSEKILIEEKTQQDEKHK